MHRASDSVTAYYSRYPIPSVLVRIIPSEGKGVGGGQTFGAPEGGFIRIQVGSETTSSDLENDWLLTHEMVHLALPSVADKHHWIEEGIATYIELIAGSVPDTSARTRCGSSWCATFHRGCRSEETEGSTTHTRGAGRTGAVRSSAS